MEVLKRGSQQIVCVLFKEHEAGILVVIHANISTPTNSEMIYRNISAPLLTEVLLNPERNHGRIKSYSQ